MSSSADQGDLFATIAESGDLCDYCKKPILVGDEFGLKFSEHIDCFDLHEETTDRKPFEENLDVVRKNSALAAFSDP